MQNDAEITDSHERMLAVSQGQIKVRLTTQSMRDRMALIEAAVEQKIKDTETIKKTATKKRKAITNFTTTKLATGVLFGIATFIVAKAVKR